MRQLLVESLVLAIPGAVIGGALIWLSPAVERKLLPRLQFSLGFDSRPDARVLIFTAALAIVAMVLVGLLPSLRATRRDIALSLSNVIGARRRSGRVPIKLRSALVVGQLVMSVVLLVTGTLFVRSLMAARSADVGFDPANRLVASVNVELQGYDEPRGRRFQDEVLTRVRQLPGVQAAAWASPVPFDGFGTRVVLYVDGMPVTATQPGLSTDASYVSEGALEAVGLRQLGGRDFRVADSAGTALAMIVSKSLASQLWPGTAAIGRSARLGGPTGPEIAVVGVVDDARYAIIGSATTPHVYLSVRQRYRGASTLVVKTASEPLAMAPAIRSIVAAADPALPMYGVGTLAGNVRSGSALPAMAAWIFGSLSLIALMIAAIGLYAVVSSTVAERTREIGVRIAMGSSPRQVLALVMMGSLRLTAIGVGVGLVLAAAVARAMSSLLVGLSPADPLTFALVPVSLIAVAVLASFLPARRAVRLDPVATLRAD